MTDGYTARKTCLKNLLIFFMTLTSWWIFAQPSFAAPVAHTPSHQVFITVQSGDTLYSLFKKQHIPPQTLASISRLPKAASALKKLHLHQTMRFTLDAKNNLESFALSLGSSQTLLVFRAGSHFVARIEKGTFHVPKISKKRSPIIVKPIKTNKPKPPIVKKQKRLPVTPPVAPKVSLKSKQQQQTAKPKASPIKPENYPPLHYTGLIIHNSFYADAQKHGIPNDMIKQLVHIFSLQINFKNTHAGDVLLLAYDDDQNIIAAEFLQGARTYTAIRYVNGQGVVEYFSPNGESMKKAFNRFPVKYTHINSLFNMHRMHPVRHIIRPHTGVDLAAPLGTPVYSTGDGQVSFIGWHGAYGNIIKIQHDPKYSTMYAHLLRFAPTLSIGTYVKRGQLIGYLGQTGNATGPHVHFEVRINDIPVNPLTVLLPQASSIPSSQIQAFQAQSKLLLAALAHYQKTQLNSP